MNYAEMAAATARQYGIDPEIFVRQMVQESGLNPGAVSPKGAVGIAQIMPDTARDPGYGVTPISDRTDPVEALRFGAQLMRAMLDEFNGDYRLALAAYNAGAGAVNKAGGIPPFEETQNYVRAILGGAGSPIGSGMSMGSPGGTTPSEDLMMGVPADEGKMSLMEMIQPMLRAQVTPEQAQALAQTEQDNLQYFDRTARPSREGIGSIVPQTSTPMAWE
jgi:hypothetical protein